MSTRASDDLQSWTPRLDRRTLPRLVWGTVLLIGVSWQTASVNAWQDSAPNDPALTGASLFPSETTVFVHLNEPGQLVERILAHPLRQKIEALDQVKKGIKSPQFQQFKLAIGLMESQIGEQWLAALQKLATGVSIGLDAGSKSAGVAIHATDQALLKKTAGAILGFAKSGGNDFKIEDFHGGKLAVLDKLTIARIDDWLLVSNHKSFLLGMAERLDQSRTSNRAPGSSLAGTPQFATAWANRDNRSDAWAFANLQTVRQSGLAHELFAGATDQPPVELLFGGILEALHEANFASANIAINHEAIAARVRLPYDASKSPRQREFFFGTRGMGRAPQPMDVPGLLGQVVTYRDLGSWWLSKEDLFPENVIAQLAQGDSQLSTLFGGVDFGEDVLGALQPGMRLLVKQQEYPDGLEPDVKIPAFALVARLQNPQDARRFRISFQSLMGLLNLDQGGMERPQIEIMTTRENGIITTGGEYLPDNNLSRGLMIYNFSPALSFQDDYMVVSSTMDFAREIAEATRSLDDTSATSDSNTRISLNGESIKQALAVNRKTLVANTMVEQGMSREQAEERIDLVLELLDYARDASLDYRVGPEAMSLDLQFRFASAR